MKILFRSHSIEKNIARNANAVPCCSLLKDDNERWNSSVRNVMSVSIILSSYGTEKNPNVGSFLGALFAFPCGIFHFAGFLNLRFVAIRWHWNCGSGFNLVPLIWGLPPNPRGDYTHHLYQCYLGHHHHVPFHYHSIVPFVIVCHLLIPVPTLDRWSGLDFVSPPQRLPWFTSVSVTDHQTEIISSSSSWLGDRGAPQGRCQFWFPSQSGPY